MPVLFDHLNAALTAISTEKCEETIMRFAILASALLGAAVEAQAAKVIVTHSGHITAGTDDYGLFTAPGADLTGFAYKIVFTMDLAQTTSGVFTYPGGSEVLGYSYGPEAVSVTIAGTSRSYSDPFEGYMSRAVYTPGTYVRQNFVSDTFDDTFAGGNTFIVTQLGSDDPMFGSVDVTTPFSYSASPGDFVGGTFYFQGDYILLADERVTSTGAIPEPASWAMMLMGFGLAGAAMRNGHRQRRLAPFRSRPCNNSEISEGI